MALTQNQLDYLNNKNQDDLQIETLEFYHPILSKRIYIVRYFDNKEYMLENGEIVGFTATNFSVKPTSYSAKLQDSKLTFKIDIINFEIASKLKEIIQSDVKLKVIYRTFSNKTNSVIFGPQIFEAEALQINAGKLVSTCSFHNFAKAQFPKVVINSNEFPGLKYV